MAKWGMCCVFLVTWHSIRSVVLAHTQMGKQAKFSKMQYYREAEWKRSCCGNKTCAKTPSKNGSSTFSGPMCARDEQPTSAVRSLPFSTNNKLQKNKTFIARPGTSRVQSPRPRPHRTHRHRCHRHRRRIDGPSIRMF